MDIGISYWFGYPSLPKERVELLKRSDFKSVSLHWTNEYKDITGDKYDVINELYSSQIKVTSFHLSYDSAHFLWEKNSMGCKYRDDINQSILDAEKYGVPCIVIHTNGNIYDDCDINYLDGLLSNAYKHKIYLCLENLQIDDNLCKILKYKFKSNYYLCYDTGHANIRNCPFPVKDNNHIKYIHFNDNFGTNDSHLLPGHGNVKWKDVILNCKSLLNDRNSIIEVHGDLKSYSEALDYLKESQESIKRLQELLRG